MTTPTLADLTLKAGAHSKPEDGLCFNEAVAYFNHQPHSDAPPCVSPVIRRYTMRLNDRWNDENRQLLKPYIPKVMGTNTGTADDNVRRWMAADWLVHEYAPAVFRAAGLATEAEQFENLAAITGAADWQAASKTVYAVRDKAREARNKSWAKRRAADADAAAAAVADADADAAADAVADAVAVAAAAAAAAADAVAVAAAAAAADADAVAAAAAAAAADADAPYKEAVKAASKAKKAGGGYYEQRDAAYRVFRPYYDKVWDERFAGLGLRESALNLLDRMIEVGKTSDLSRTESAAS